MNTYIVTRFETPDTSKHWALTNTVTGVVSYFTTRATAQAVAAVLNAS